MNDSTSAISPVWPTRWPKDSFKGFWTWLLAGAIAALFGLLLVLQLLVPAPKSISPAQLNAVLIVQLIADAILVAIVLLALPSLSKFSLRDLGFRVPTLATIGIGILGAFAMALAAEGTALLINLVARTEHQQDIVQMFKGLHDHTTIGLFAVFAIVFAPFAEETLFRVFFFNIGLRFGGFWTGAIVSGLLFGIAHADLFELIPLALGGIVLCGVYYITRNAFASMISHALFNSFSIVMLLMFPKLTQ
ncbi:MAG TPA: type II CAAX endopeptidase family protein [Candidatus Acidoferrum sp.]|nr:type II CAAX endopeptidase family protein [Candidatus Acidoferrum sp.]